MRVLFVSGIDGFCHRYQVLHRAAQLASLGAATTIRYFTDPRLLDEVATHDLLFVYRVPETARVHAALDLAGDLGVPRVAVIDDLIFVDDPLCLPPLDHLSDDERALWREGVRRYRATIERCDAFVAPTEPLVQIGDGLGWRSHLHRNSVSWAELELGRRARATAAPRPVPVLGYFSGTPSHDEDFASISRALRDTLHAHPSARLLLAGPLVLPDELAPFADRIDRHALVGWQELPALIAATDVCLAPLLAERRFASAKGEIKYLEAAVVGVPTVATSTSAYRHAICDGENGHLATTQDEWRRALDHLLREPAARARLGAAATADVVKRYGESARGAELLAFVGEVRGGLRRRTRATIDDRAREPVGDESPARVALEPDACPVFTPTVPADVAPPLSASSRIAQRIRIGCDGLARVDVHAVTFGQALDQTVHLLLRRDDGTLVGTRHLPAGELPDRRWVALDLDAPEPTSGGRTYLLEIVVDGTAGGATPTFGISASAAGGDEHASAAVGPATLDGKPLAGALALRAFAEWALALAQGDGSDGAAVRLPGGVIAASASSHDGAAAPGLAAGTTRA